MLIYRYRIFGRVQGVGYRAFAQALAHKLNLAGWVRNLPDGSVECCAKGGEQELQEFEKKLWEGPPLSRVTEVQKLACEETELPFPFTIKR